MAVCTFSFGQMTSLDGFLVTRFGQGLAGAATATAASALLITHSPELGTDLGINEVRRAGL